MQFLIENSYFTVGNVLLLQTVGIPMRTDSPPFKSGELKLKVEDNGSHSTFPDLDIAIEKGKSIYKMIFGQRF